MTAQPKVVNFPPGGRTSYGRLSYEELNTKPVLSLDMSLKDLLQLIGEEISTSSDAKVEAMKMFACVESNPSVLGGLPVIKGTRIPVGTILACVADGYTKKEIAADYGLGVNEVEEALYYASEALGAAGQSDGGMKNGPTSAR